MNKVIKSAFEDSSYRLEVCKNVGAEHVSLWILGSGSDAASIAIADKDVPSLMLALGEAAGVVPKVPTQYLYGTPEHLALIQWHLAKYSKAQAAIAAQEEETAKLEAEAVQLYEVHREIMDYEACTWELLDDVNKRYWVALARKAREIDN